MPAWAWVVISLVVVLIIGCVAVIAALSYVGTRVSQSFSTIGAGLIESFQPVTVASDFYTDLVTKDYDSAHQLLSSDLAFKYTSDDLKAKWEALESAQGKITPSFPTTGSGTFRNSSNKNSVAVEQELISANGKTYSVTLTMQKSGDTWVIQDASPGLIPEP